MRKAWIMIKPGEMADKIKNTAERDVTQETILADEDIWNDVYIAPIMMQDWIPGIFEGLVQRQPQTRNVYLTVDQVEVIRRVEE